MNIKAKIYSRTNGSGTHYARIILPKELRVFVAKPAVWRSLATKDDAEAHNAGIVTSTATRMVFQEVCDTHLANEKENAVVIVETELVGVKIDIDAIKGEADPEELMAIADSLRLSFGIPSKGKSKSEKPSAGSTNKPTPSTKTRSRKADKEAKEKSAAGESPLMIQTMPAPPIDGGVVQFIEKRPHGVYRFRYWIPRLLQDLFGQREVRFTLKTKDREAAIEKAMPLFIELREKLQRLQGVNCSA
jgi:hypothetical protein